MWLKEDQRPSDPDNVVTFQFGCISRLLFVLFLISAGVTFWNYVCTSDSSTAKYVKNKSQKIDLELHNYFDPYLDSTKASLSDENGNDSSSDNQIPDPLPLPPPIPPAVLTNDAQDDINGAFKGDIPMEENNAFENGIDKNVEEEGELPENKIISFLSGIYSSSKKFVAETDKIKTCRFVFWTTSIYFAVTIPLWFLIRHKWKKIREKAMLGDAKFQIELGRQYLKRYAREKKRRYSFIYTIFWSPKPGEPGYDKFLLDNDSSTDDDFYEAYIWFSKAARQGSPEGWYWVAHLHEISKDYEFAAEFYDVSAKLNYKPAEVSLQYIVNYIDRIHS